MKDYRNSWGNSLDLGPGSADLSADLEWVLQSGQSDRNLVAEGLLHVYYAPVYRLCLVLETNLGRSHELLIQIFAKAVNQAYHYRARTGIPIWFYTCLLQALPRATLKERRAHLPVLLHVFADLSADQITILFNQKASRVEARFQKLESEPGTILGRAGLPSDVTTGLMAGPSWRQALQQRYPAPGLEDSELEALAVEIVARAEKRSAIRRRLILLQELILLVFAALAVAGLILAADSFSPALTTRTPPPTVIVTRIVEREVSPVIVVFSTATPGPPYPTPSPVKPPQRLAPLSVDSSPLSILERLHLSKMFWETVWAETITVLYGPPGYLGPDRIHRSQFWLGNDQARVQSGPLEGPPDELWVGNHREMYAIKSQDGFDHLPVMVAGGSLKHPMMADLGLLFDPLQPLGGEVVDTRSWQVRITGRDRVAGREAVVVELLNISGARAARLWLDTQTDFVLRHQQFRPAGERNPSIETIVTRILFDLDFENQALFDLENPSVEAFANDPLGNPSRGLPTIEARANWESNPQPAYIPPPANFNPAKSSLSFLYPLDFDLQSLEVPVDLFAADYFLGSITFANPWWMICERSPDGRRIAFSSRPLLSPQFSSTLRWLDLNDMRVRAQRIFPGGDASDLAFSPDSLRLVFYGFSSEGQGIYLADLNSDAVRMLAPIYQARSLAWSPDGDQIALIGWVPNTSGGEKLVVLDAASGEMVYHASYHAGDLLPGDAPLLGWGADFLRSFPAQPGGLEACAAPPTSNTTP